MSAIAEAVLSRVDQSQPDACWLWPGAKTPVGYGKIGRDGRTLYVHRVVCEAACGGPLPRGAVVMHTCDTPSCCNPHHLRVGTKADNSADMVRKRRSRAGEAHPLSRLTASDAETIRRAVAGGETQRSVAARYGVSFQHVSDIVAGRKWGPK